MALNNYTPPQENCPDCEELISTECIIEKDSLPGIGIGSGKTLKRILERISKRISKIYTDLKSTILNVTPVYDTGLPIFTYKENSCDAEEQAINIPLFLNGKFCFEYDVDNTVLYDNVDSYHLFFNLSHCSGVYVDPDDTIQLTTINGLVLTSPIIIKNPGETILSISETDKTLLLNEVNSLTGSTFTDIVIDESLTINGDLAIGFVDIIDASVTFTTTLTFEFEVLDNLLVNKNTINENITVRNISGTGITTIVQEEFSVDSVGGVYTFFDELNVEITDQTIIDTLINLIKTQQVRNICCDDCTNSNQMISMVLNDVLGLRAPGGSYISNTVINSELFPRQIGIFGDFNNGLVEIADDLAFTTNVKTIARSNSTSTFYFTFSVPENKFYRITSNGSSLLFWNEFELKIV